MRKLATVRGAGAVESVESFSDMLQSLDDERILSSADDGWDKLEHSDVSREDSVVDSRDSERLPFRECAAASFLQDDEVTTQFAASVSDPRIDFANVFQSASQSLTPKPIRNVWEDGVWSCIFGNGNLMQAWGNTGFSFHRPQQTVGACKYW